MPDKRAYNFSAGPAVLPEPVIEQAQKDLFNFRGSGMGVCELSHRGPEFDAILEEARADARTVGKVPDNFQILFLQGGATTQADTIPMSWLPEGTTADYINTGKWADDAIKEARLVGKGSVNVAASTKEINYQRLPYDNEYSFTQNAAYCLYVSNNTIYGTRFVKPPKTDAPIIADMSSEMYARPIDWEPLSMTYAGAQKNLGPSGQVMCCIRDDFLAKAPKENLGRMFDYNIQAQKESRFNTPNTFAIYLMGQTFKWILKEFGTLEQVEQFNNEKAALIYDTLDNSDFYTPHVTEPDHRSVMNIPFKAPTPELDAEFVNKAHQQGLTTLKGHRSTGGMRASIYNAMPREGCQALADFMKTFEREHANKSTAAAN